MYDAIIVNRASLTKDQIMYTRHHNARSATIAIMLSFVLTVVLTIAAAELARAETYPVAPVQFIDGAVHARGFNVRPGTSAKLNCALGETVVGYDAAVYNVGNPTMSTRVVGVFTVRRSGNGVVVFAPNGYVANIGSRLVAVEVICE